MFNMQLKRDIMQLESFYMLFKHELYLNVRKLELDENKRKDVVMLKLRNKRTKSKDLRGEIERKVLLECNSFLLVYR